MISKRRSIPSLASLQAFDSAARLLSFTRAADELALTQSAVSRQIQTLEDGVGLSLFRRTGNRLVLTENQRSDERLFKFYTTLGENL